MLNPIKGKSKSNGRKKKEILINIEPLETRVVVLDNGKLDNFHIERADDNRIDPRVLGNEFWVQRLCQMFF